MNLLVYIYFACVAQLSISKIVQGSNITTKLKRQTDTTEKILDQLLKSPDYNKIIRPSDQTNVSLQLYFRNFYFLDDIKMELGMQVTLRLQWMDERHNYEHLLSDLKPSEIPEYIVFSDPSRIWYPDIYLRNEKKGMIHEILKPNILVRIYRNGSTLFSARVSMELGCPMRLHWYPFDTHRCSLQFASYSLVSSELLLTWHPYEPIQLRTSAYSLTRFTFEKYLTQVESFTTGVGVYQNALLGLYFRREFGYYVLNVYAPLSILVVVSWISFWFDVTAIDARIALGITTILTVATQIFGINQVSPVVSYAKAVDIFTSACQLLVSLALLEFATVDFTLRWLMNRYKSCSMNKVSDYSKVEQQLLLDFEATAKRKAKRIDLISRVLFPAMFAGFLAVYFSVCFNHELKYVDDDS